MPFHRLIWFIWTRGFVFFCFSSRSKLHHIADFIWQSRTAGTTTAAADCNISPTSGNRAFQLPLPPGLLRGGRRSSGLMWNDGKPAESDPVAQHGVGPHHVRDTRCPRDRPDHQLGHAKLSSSLGHIHLHHETRTGSWTLQEATAIPGMITQLNWLAFLCIYISWDPGSQNTTIIWKLDTVEYNFFRFSVHCLNICKNAYFSNAFQGSANNSTVPWKYLLIHPISILVIRTVY